jgi:hypothetical protein
MKRIILILLAVVLALSGIEWDSEQITSESGDRYRPLLALAPDGSVRAAWMEGMFFKYASNASGAWVVEDVDPELGCDMEFFDIAVDSDGNIHILYTGMSVNDEEYDICYATDKSGSLERYNLTNTGGIQVALNICLDRYGKPNILYAVHDEMESEMYLCYGWIDNSNVLHAEVVSEKWIDIEEGSDLVVDDDGTVHIFYIDTDDFYLWYIRGKPSAWGEDFLLSDLDNSYPCAALDDQGSLHVVYSVWEEGGAYANYHTNQTGMWHDEVICEEEKPHRYPCIAIDADDNPHVVWENYDKLAYTNKIFGEWTYPELINLPQEKQSIYMGPTFTVDNQGYGHLVYTDWEEEQVFYAKSKSPLAVAEETSSIIQPLLEVRGRNIHFNLPQSSNVTLDLYDAAGRRVKCIASGAYPAGEHQISFNTSELSSGVYFVRIEAGRQQASAKFVLTH